MTYPKIRFQGNDYIFVGERGETQGPIATPEAFARGECSYAHLFSDGRVLRFQEQIGTRADIEWLGEDVEVAPKADVLLNMLTHPSWDGPPEE